MMASIRPLLFASTEAKGEWAMGHQSSVAEVHADYVATGHRLSAKAFRASTEAYRSGSFGDHEKAFALHERAAAHWEGWNSDHAEHMAKEHRGNAVHHGDESIRDRIHQIKNLVGETE